ncbi:unnamed protein product, partial [Cyprideis torosa]
YSGNNEKTESSHQIEKVRILIVDDDADARFTIGELVKSLGYETTFATNGYECLEKLKTEVPDLILLDIMMPKMDGFQTIKKIREHKDYKKLNVFALTAYAMLSDKEIIEKNGFDGLFTKPLNTSQIERKLNREGFKVITAYDGIAGVKKAVDEGPDLILLDVMMPGVDGLEACRNISENPITKNIPIILVTALNSSEDTQKGFDA